MTREEAIKVLEIMRYSYTNVVEGALDMAISALMEQEHKRYTTHDVACIIDDLFDGACACNVNDISEWLPQKCELPPDACPKVIGVACWEQYLKHRCGRRLEEV